jgi:hypothetical protein
MRKYDPLTSRLRTIGSPVVTMAFAEIEDAIEAKLPRSAHEYDEWWDNDAPGRRTDRQCCGWKQAGYLVMAIDRGRGIARFERTRNIRGGHE